MGKTINCGAHIKMAKGCGQVASRGTSDVAVTMIDLTGTGFYSFYEYN
jgi:hypothetical protein